MLSAYRQGNFGAAGRLARRAGESATGSKRDRLLRLAGRIQRFATAYQAVRGSGGTAQQREEAIALDKGISGGYYARRMKKPVVRDNLADAKRAWSRADAKTACRLVRQALAVDRNNREAKGMASRCEVRAGELFREAQRIESSNPTRARARSTARSPRSRPEAAPCMARPIDG